MKILKNGYVVDPASDLNGYFCITIDDNGTIKSIDKKPPENADEIFDLEGKLVVPSFFDIHVHSRDPGGPSSIEETAKAAAKGGITDLLMMPNTNPPMDNLEVYHYITDKVRKQHIRMYQSACITKKREGKELVEFYTLSSMGVSAFTDDGSDVRDSGLLYRAMLYCNQANSLFIFHNEDADLMNNGVLNEGITSTRLGVRGIPNEAEEAALARNLAIAHRFDVPIHIAHLSSGFSLEIIEFYKKYKRNISVEVTPHHLLLTDTGINGEETSKKTNPPIRSESDRKKLVEYLRTGKIDVIASDHAPHSAAAKNCELESAAFGTIGLETMVPLIYTYFVKEGVIDLKQMIRLMNHNPAWILGKEPNKIGVGKPANIAVLDTEAKKVIDFDFFCTKCKNSAFLGWEITGIPVLTLSNGVVVYNALS